MGVIGGADAGVNGRVNWPALLEQILNGEDIGAGASSEALNEIMGGVVPETITAAFLVSLRAKGATADEVAGMARSMLENAVPVPVGIGNDLLDTCGTGGDGHGTVNVSTMAAIVCAGAGVRVAKHGNRAASSKCGSADVLEALGVFIALGPSEVAECIDTAGIGFFFAPVFHPAMRHVGPVRSALGIRTVFNILGPLANPARPKYQVVGVPNEETADVVVRVLRLLGTQSAMVVLGSDGMDEITTTGVTRVWRLSNDHIDQFAIDCDDLGVTPAALEDLCGGDAATNAEIARDTLAGKTGPVRDIVVANAAAGLVTAGKSNDFGAAMAEASESIDSGAAGAALDSLIETSRRLGAVR